MLLTMQLKQRICPQPLLGACSILMNETFQSSFMKYLVSLWTLITFSTHKQSIAPQIIALIFICVIISKHYLFFLFIDERNAYVATTTLLEIRQIDINAELAIIEDMVSKAVSFTSLNWAMNQHDAPTYCCCKSFGHIAATCWHNCNTSSNSYDWNKKSSTQR